MFQSSAPKGGRDRTVARFVGNRRDPFRGDARRHRARGNAGADWRARLAQLAARPPARRRPWGPARRAAATGGSTARYAGSRHRNQAHKSRRRGWTASASPARSATPPCRGRCRRSPHRPAASGAEAWSLPKGRRGMVECLRGDDAGLLQGQAGLDRAPCVWSCGGCIEPRYMHAHERRAAQR